MGRPLALALTLLSSSLLPLFTHAAEAPNTRIVSIGPLEAIWDEAQGDAGTPKPTGGVAVQIDSNHPDTQFIQSEDDSVEEILSRVIDATTD